MEKYIKLSDVNKILDRAKYFQVISDWYTIRSPAIGIDVINISAIQAINSLPSIDFEWMIKEMIKDLTANKIANKDKPNLYNNLLWWTDALQELLNKLPK